MEEKRRKNRLRVQKHRRLNKIKQNYNAEVNKMKNRFKMFEIAESATSDNLIDDPSDISNQIEFKEKLRIWVKEDMGHNVKKFHFE